jgi:endonuclease G, mitochondrial
VFTIPLYLPHKDKDGKSRVVSGRSSSVMRYVVHNLFPSHAKTYEVIGNPPNVAVPTHFAKVVLAARPSSPSTPHVPEVSTGAFVLPNAVISDETPLESFVYPSTSRLRS